MDARKILQNKNLTVTRIPASNDVEVEEVQPDIGQLASTGDLQTVSGNKRLLNIGKEGSSSKPHSGLAPSELEKKGKGGANKELVGCGQSANRDSVEISRGTTFARDSAPALMINVDKINSRSILRGGSEHGFK